MENNQEFHHLSANDGAVPNYRNLIKTQTNTNKLFVNNLYFHFGIKSHNYGTLGEDLFSPIGPRGHRSKDLLEAFLFQALPLGVVGLLILSTSKSVKKTCDDFKEDLEDDLSYDDYDDAPFLSKLGFGLFSALCELIKALIITFLVALLYPVLIISFIVRVVKALNEMLGNALTSLRFYTNVLSNVKESSEDLKYFADSRNNGGPSTSNQKYLLQPGQSLVINKDGKAVMVDYESSCDEDDDYNSDEEDNNNRAGMSPNN